MKLTKTRRHSEKKYGPYPHISFRCNTVMDARIAAVIKAAKGKETLSSIGQWCMTAGLPSLESKYGLVAVVR